ncbi:MAG TPA: 5'-nucleotidase C-terminal domain-containing protein, partial [Symbiobacteriaceae bacterium]|nr:5'-nucleotidase C-terminal domain-containing protein [Symbiobacteriaceae bacterium]
LGPLVTLGDLRTCFPYDDVLHRVTVTGAILKRMFSHFMRPANQANHGEYFQVNGAVRAVYCRADDRLVSLTLRGEAVADERTYTVCLQGYHYSIAAKALGVEPAGMGPARVASTASREVLEEYLRAHQNLNARVEGRLVYR